MYGYQLEMLLNVSCFKWYLGMNQLDSQCIHKYRLNGSLKFTAWAMILRTVAFSGH